MKTRDGFHSEAERVAPDPPGPTADDLLLIEADSGDGPPDTMKWRPTDAELAELNRLMAEARGTAEVT